MRGERSWIVSPRRTRVVLALAALIALTALGSLALEITTPPELTGRSGPTGLSTLTALVFLIAGAPVAARRPGHPIGRIFLGTAFAWAAGGVLTQFVLRAAVSGGPYPPALVVLAWLNYWSWVAGVMPAIVLAPQFFPDGRLLSPRWRFLPMLTWLGIAMLIAGASVADYEVLPGVRNPFRAEGLWSDLLQSQGAFGSYLAYLAYGIVLVAAVLTIATLVIRTRRGTRTERQQLRVLLAAAVIFPTTLILAIIWSALDASQGTTPRPPPFILQLMLVLGLLALPLAIAIAILRYRLYDIDVVIKRTVVYAALLLMLLATYGIVVIVVGTLARPLTGSSELAVAGSTLVVVLLFQPLRSWILRAVDRQFYRAQYDAQRTVDAFAEQLRDEIDLAALDTELTRVVSAALRPSYVSLWLKPR